MKIGLVLALSLSLFAGCAGVDDALRRIAGTSIERTFEAPVARVKPAFVSTLAQIGLPVSAIETRGGNEVVKARKADKSVEIEFERLSATSTRVRITGSSDTAGQVMRETEKRLAAG